MSQEPSDFRAAAARATRLAWIAAAAFAVTWLPQLRRGDVEPADSPPDGYRLRIDLRTASAEELQLIPNFGPKLSEAWVRQRPELLTKHRDPLRAIAEVRGVGPAKLAEIRRHAIDYAASPPPP